MSMDGVNFAPANTMEFKNDTLKYEMNEGSFKLTFESKTKMKGIAYWASGQSELILTKKEYIDADLQILSSKRLIFFKIRPSLTTSKEGLKTLNIHNKTTSS
jgi:hypothetical protein